MTKQRLNNNQTTSNQRPNNDHAMTKQRPDGDQTTTKRRPNDDPTTMCDWALNKGDQTTTQRPSNDQTRTKRRPNDDPTTTQRPYVTGSLDDAQTPAFFYHWRRAWKGHGTKEIARAPDKYKANSTLCFTCFLYMVACRDAPVSGNRGLQLGPLGPIGTQWAHN